MPDERVYAVLDWHEQRITGAFTTEFAAQQSLPDTGYGGLEIQQTDLHRPDLRPIYGGATLLEALWSEMDRLMEGLMTGQDAEGDKFRAQELAWVLAIVANPYEPSVDGIRAETMRRWEAAERETSLQEEALNPDEQHQTDAAGVNGYEL